MKIRYVAANTRGWSSFLGFAEASYGEDSSLKRERSIKWTSDKKSNGSNEWT